MEDTRTEQTADGSTSSNPPGSDHDTLVGVSYAHGRRLRAMFPIYENPSTPTAVLKEEFRALAHKLMIQQDTAENPAAIRSFAEALTCLETASMYAVKGLHQNKREE